MDYLLETTRFQTTVKSFHIYIYMKMEKVNLAIVMLLFRLFQQDWNNIAVKNP